MGDDCELLFFDTFSHETCEELNLDLVQFPRPVYIFEIRIVPLGAIVQADFPGGHRLGATNPSSFQLEFFVNDLSKRSACTFEKLGSLDYKQNIDIQFPVPNKIPTDGLVLRGWYSAVTLAVYGVLTKITKERSSPPPPPSNARPDHCRTKDFDPSVDTGIPVEWDCTPRLDGASQDAPPPTLRGPIEGQHFVDVPPMIHPPPPEQHVVYSGEMTPQNVFSEPPPPLVYQECVPIPQVPAPPAPYPPYEAHYPKPWTEEPQYQPQNEPYEHQMYNRPSEGTIYPPLAEPPPHGMWDNKDHRGIPDGSGHERDGYQRPILLDHPGHRDKDRDRNRDRPWDRDLHHADDGGRMRDHDPKRNKDRGHRSRETSWERNVEADRYRDRDRASRDRDRSRDKPPRMHDMFMDRRNPPKRPTTPPSPRKGGGRPHTPPQTPPEYEKVGPGGPRTPKEEEPPDMYDERTDEVVRPEHFFEGGMLPPEHAPPGDPMYHLSEGEIQEGDNTEEDDGYEEIVSEEEDMSDLDDRIIDMQEMEFDLGDETWDYMSSFNPYNCELTTFQHFSDPTLFEFEIAKKKKETCSLEVIVKECLPESSKIIEFWNISQDTRRTERWVEMLEGINECFLCELVSVKAEVTGKDVMDTLAQWAKDGLDFDLALNQPQTAFKVRHLKAGVRLATLLLRTHPDAVSKLLELDIPKLLLELFDQPYMALPLKLFIIRALDAATTTQPGLEYVVRKTFVFSKPKDFDCCKPDELKNDEELFPDVSKTCYQKLLEIMVSRQLTRVIVSLSALLCKIHIYEILTELSDCVEKVVQSSQGTETKLSIVDSPETLDQRSISVESELDTGETVISNTGETFAQVIVSCLQDLTTTYCNAWNRVAQTKRHLPARNQFENPVSPFDPFPGLLRMFKENHLLQNVFVLTSSPPLAGHPGVISALRDLLLQLLTTQSGMLFLLGEPDVITGILRTLLQTVDETREEASDENIAQNLGMQIAHHLQALLYVDCLMAFHAGAKKGELDNPECVSALHHMCTMIFTPVGRHAVVSVLSTADNLKALLPFVEMSGEQAVNIKQSKSVCAGYVTELLMLVVRYSESITMLERFSDVLYNLSQQECSPKLHHLGAWMAPTRGLPNYKHEAVFPLMAILKLHIETAASLPAELVTTIRILQHITLPPDNFGNDNVELKYVYAIIQVFANDGMASFLSILQNICDTFLKPSHQSPALTGLQGVMVVAIVKPTISMLRSILSHLISSRKTEFRDLTTVPVLLKVFSLMLLIPPSSASFQLAQTVQSEIIEALLTYTQPILGSAESEEALSKSLWTKMVQEVLKYVNLSPCTFITSLTVLSELLPLPFPLQTREPLQDEEIVKAVNYRKLWSAHLHSLSTTIQEVILSLAATSCHQLQQLLRRVCVQLSDLAAPTALVIVRAVLDALMDALVLPGMAEQKENQDPSTSSATLLPSEAIPTLKPPTSSTARILTLVSYLVSHTSFKIPMMHILRGSVKADEKYVDVLPVLLELLNGPSDKPFIIQAQECIVSIFQSFCDPDIGFLTFDGGALVNEVLSCSLPSKEHMSQICGALIEHIGDHEHNYSSILPSLRTLVMLTEHDYGYFHVKQGLDQHQSVLYSLFSRFSLSFSKDSSDCLSTLSTTLEFLRLMVQGYEDGPQTGRTLLLSTSELVALLKDKDKKDEVDDKKNIIPFQPVCELEKLLTECGNDEEAVESLLESISGLLQLLNNAATKENKIDKELSEPLLPAPESQSAQFASRSVFMVGDVEEGRLSPAYWLSLPGAEDTDQEQEQVSVDLLSVAEKHIPGDFDLKSTLENLCLSTDAEEDLKLKKKCSLGGKRKYQPLINPGIPDVNSKRPFIAPMRGRGFNRASSHSTRANDPFRSRPPNTSRPPSMHVDDFVALESHHSGNNLQTQVKRPTKEGPRGRGRGGFERNFSSNRGTSGRFFASPGLYGRRDSNRGGNRGLNRISNNAWGNRSNQNQGSGQKISPGTMPRNNFGNRRCDYNSTFNQQDSRLAGQRGRDSYTDLDPSSGVVALNRFSRGPRVVTSMGQAPQGHWQDNRVKMQNQRFMTPCTAGRGRRDLNAARHNRSFTR